MYRNIYHSRFGSHQFFGACYYSTLEKALSVGKIRNNMRKYIKTVKIISGLPVRINKICNIEYIDYV